MKEVFSTEVLFTFYQTTWCYIPEDHNFISYEYRIFQKNANILNYCNYLIIFWKDLIYVKT
jgi:hypothetical protein